MFMSINGYQLSDSERQMCLRELESVHHIKDTLGKAIVDDLLHESRRKQVVSTQMRSAVQIA